jgi:hypothetical protein
MFESLKNWNQTRKLSPHEKFIARVGRRIVENSRREAEGKPAKGWVVKSAEAPRYAYKRDPSAILVPSAEWQGIDYGDLTEEDKQRMVEQFESPPSPEVMSPNPDETFAMPMSEPPGWVKKIVADRLAELEQPEQ